MPLKYFKNLSKTLNHFTFDNLLSLERDLKEKNNELRLCLTYACHQNCKFCYSTELKKKYPKDMSIEDFTLYLNWLKRQKFSTVHFLGGEPTVYPRFTEALDICREKGIKVILYTNLVFNKRILESLTPDVIHTLIAHYQLPRYYSNSAHKIFHKNLSYVSKRGYLIVIRHNFTAPNSPYKYVINTALKYGIKLIRTSIIEPEFHNNIEKLNLNRMRKIAPSMVAFAKECKEKRLIPVIRTSHPFCIFSDSERDYLIKNAFMRGTCFSQPFFLHSLRSLGVSNWLKRQKSILANYHIFANYMRNNCYINPDLTFQLCVRYSLKSEKRITDYKNVEDIHKTFWKTFKKQQWTPRLPECMDCKFFKKKSCQGGCLSDTRN